MKKKKPNKQLNRLIKEWDEKLKASGFNDIEDRKRDTLKSWSGTSWLITTTNGVVKPSAKKTNYGYTTLAWKESQAEYYRLAAQCLHEAEFKTTQQRLIWQLHSEGLSYAEISPILNLTVRKIRYAIEQMAEEFGLKFCRK